MPQKQTSDQKNIIQSINQLIPIFQKIAQGNLSVDIPKDKDERLKDFYVSIHNMLADFKSLIEENKKKHEALIQIQDQLEQTNDTLEQIVNLKTKELQETERRYELLFQTIDSGVAIYEVKNNGTKFYFKDFNKRAEEIEGLKKNKIIGKEIRTIFPGAEAMGIIQVFKTVYKTGKTFHFPEAEYKDVKKGISYWRENFVYKMANDEIVAVFRDISKEKEIKLEMEENLKELNKFNELMVGRELKMIELKQEIKKLKEKIAAT